MWLQILTTILFSRVGKEALCSFILGVQWHCPVIKSLFLFNLDKIRSDRICVFVCVYQSGNYLIIRRLFYLFNLDLCRFKYLEFLYCHITTHFHCTKPSHILCTSLMLKNFCVLLWYIVMTSVRTHHLYTFVLSFL